MNLSTCFQLFLLSCLLCATSACSNQTTSDAPANASPEQATTAKFPEIVNGKRGGTLRYRLTSPPKTFNYLMVNDETSLVVAFQLTGGRLAEFDHAKQAYVPALAESWQASADGKTFDVVLRDGLKFSDGQPLTSSDVEFTLRALYDERTGAQSYRDSLLVDGKPLTISTLDARRMSITFPEAIAAPESYLANICVLPRHILEADFKAGKIGASYSVTTAPTRIVTAGAFAVDSIVPGERVTFKRNPFYWKKDAAGTQLPYLDNVVLDVVADQNAAFAKLNENNLDIIDRLRPSDYAALASPDNSAANNLRVYDLGPGLNTDYVWFNLHTGANAEGKAIVDPIKAAWFNDQNFRRALAFAVDREGIAAGALQGLATPLFGFVSPGNKAWIAADLPALEYNLERAKTLLQAAGYNLQAGANGEQVLLDKQGNPVSFSLIVPVENQPRVQMAAVLQEDFAKLGIRVAVSPIEFGQLTARWSKSFDYDAVLLGSSISEPDPSSYNGLVLSNGSIHQWNPAQSAPATDWERRVDELMNAQAHERDEARRHQIFREVQMIYAEQMPIIPIVARHITVAANPRVANLRSGITPPFSLWNAEQLFVRQ